ncbi:MAG: Gfo/Idh/MocA family oxidoreductase [Clostridia bacterium]|nr:Gfo/Idh/MocA family oxidoreductase [Clostridia bacterium]
MKRVRFGVVGFGGRGRNLAKSAALMEISEFVAACDLFDNTWYEQQQGHAAPFADMFSDTHFYNSYDEMLENEELDAVIVETGAEVHTEFCCKALKKNINVLSDIPIVASLQEADYIWKVAKESKANIMVGSNVNFQRFVVKLKEFYEKGLLGKPYCMECQYIHWPLPKAVFEYKNADWRNHLSPIRYCTHSLGPLLTIVEEELKYVSCFGTGMHADEYEDGMDIDDMQCAQFKTESGVIIRLMRNGRCTAKMGHHKYRVFGTEGYMEKEDILSPDGKGIIRYNSTRELENVTKEMDGKYLPFEYENHEYAKNLPGHGGIDYAMIEHFFKALINGEKMPVTLKEGLAMTLPGIYAEESAKRNGEVIRMTYPWNEDWSTEF